MTVLEWDLPGDRRYEAGIDRGVLYLSSDEAVAWNGLTQITEKVTRDVKEYYVDGIKYLDHHVPGAYSAQLEAFTYPDEFATLLGTSEYAPGVFLHDQSAGLFHLSYRTGLGDDLQGLDKNYRIHVLYNLMASANDVPIATGGGPVNAKPFSWSLAGTPAQMIGARPTNHMSIDTRLVDPDMLTVIENTLYGTELSDPYLPPLVQFLEILAP